MRLALLLLAAAVAMAADPEVDELLKTEREKVAANGRRMPSPTVFWCNMPTTPWGAVAKWFWRSTIWGPRNLFRKA